MTQFTKGDRVVRTHESFLGVKEGGEYTVSRQCGSSLYLEGHEVSYWADKFALSRDVRPAPIKPEGAYNPNVGHTKDGGGLQQHSVGGPYPYIVVAIDNPTGLKPGLYYYVQDKAGDRCTPHTKSAEKVIRQAATLAEQRPSGLTGSPTPGLERSEGYIEPLSTLVTIELTREAAEVLQLMCAHTAGPLPGHILPVISEALGYGYDETKARHDVSFWGYGPEYTSGWHKGRNTQGALAITHKGAL